MQEKEQLLKDTIESTQKTIETNAGVLFSNYDKQINAIIESRPLIEQFKKLTKEYDTLQFYLKEVTQVDLFNVLAKYKGIDIASITISKDKTTITTETYDKSNKELFKCNTQLKQEEFNSINTMKFLEHFKRDDIIPKTKPNKETQESMLLAEFSKTSSYDKLLTGIQPIKVRQHILPNTYNYQFKNRRYYKCISTYQSTKDNYN